MSMAEYMSTPFRGWIRAGGSWRGAGAFVSPNRPEKEREGVWPRESERVPIGWACVGRAEFVLTSGDRRGWGLLKTAHLPLFFRRSREKEGSSVLLCSRACGEPTETGSDSRSAPALLTQTGCSALRLDSADKARQPRRGIRARPPGSPRRSVVWGQIYWAVNVERLSPNAQTLHTGTLSGPETMPPAPSSSAELSARLWTDFWMVYKSAGLGYRATAAKNSRTVEVTASRSWDAGKGGLHSVWQIEQQRAVMWLRRDHSQHFKSLMLLTCNAACRGLCLWSSARVPKSSPCDLIGG